MRSSFGGAVGIEAGSILVAVVVVVAVIAIVGVGVGAGVKVAFNLANVQFKARR